MTNIFLLPCQIFLANINGAFAKVWSYSIIFTLLSLHGISVDMRIEDSSLWWGNGAAASPPPPVRVEVRCNSGAGGGVGS